MPRAASVSKASLRSTNAQSSWRCVASANIESNRLVRPDDTGPISSAIAPLGRPPDIESISCIPLGINSDNGAAASFKDLKRPVSADSISDLKAEILMTFLALTNVPGWDFRGEDSIPFPAGMIHVPGES
jgi:hypothetical protein